MSKIDCVIDAGGHHRPVSCYTVKLRGDLTKTDERTLNPRIGGGCLNLNFLEKPARRV
jgi:hypothetical protein